MPRVRSTSGDGASSMIFWWRRWIEHSRSPTAQHRAVLVGQHLHLDVAAARSGSGSQNTVGSPNADAASRLAASIAPARSAEIRARRACRARRRRPTP